MFIILQRKHRHFISFHPRASSSLSARGRQGDVSPATRRNSRGAEFALGACRTEANAPDASLRTYTWLQEGSIREPDAPRERRNLSLFVTTGEGTVLRGRAGGSAGRTGAARRSPASPSSSRRRALCGGRAARAGRGADSGGGARGGCRAGAAAGREMPLAPPSARARATAPPLGSLLACQGGKMGAGPAPPAAARIGPRLLPAFPIGCVAGLPVPDWPARFWIPNSKFLKVHGEGGRALTARGTRWLQPCR